MSIMENIKTTLGIGVGGELAEVQAAIRDCRPVYPPGVLEGFKKAEKIMHDLRFDSLNRSGEIGFEEAQLNQKLHNEAEAIYKAKINADELAEKKRKELHERKQEIERDITRWRSRRTYLGGSYKEDHHDQQCGTLERNLREHEYTLTRDKKYLLSEFGKFEDEIKALEDKMVAATDLDRIELALQVRDAELRRQNFMVNVYPRYKADFESRENQAREWTRQLKVWKDGYQEALEQCDAELIRLVGRCD